MVQHLRWEPNSFCSSVPQWSCPAQVCCWQQTMAPSGMSPFWLGSCNNSFLRIVPTQVRWQLWQPFPQDCSHSGLVAFVLALPSGLAPLWQGGRCGNLPLKTVPTLARWQLFLQDCSHSGSSSLRRESFLLCGGHLL